MFCILKKIIASLLFLCFCACNFVSASDCNKQCNDKACSTPDNATFRWVTEDSGGNRICSNTTYGFGNAVIGWGKTCATPVGEQSPSEWSCITAGNVFGQIIDTFTTLGIAIQMRKDFCSFSPGNRNLEGATIDSGALNVCYGQIPRLSGSAAHNCISCVLKGKTPKDNGIGCKSPDPNKGCYNSNTPTNPNLCIDNYINKNTSPNTALCNGIPNLERPLLDDGGNQIFTKITDENNNTTEAPVYCPIMRCNIPTDDIRFKYYDAVGPRTAIMAALGVGIGGIISEAYGSCCDQGALEGGQQRNVALWHTVQIRAQVQGDQTCLQMWFPTGWSTLACKSRTPPEVDFPCPACFIRKTPFYQGDSESKWIFPITSNIIQATTEIFDAVITGKDYEKSGNSEDCDPDTDPSCCKDPEGSTCSLGGLTTFQNNMKDIVRILLVLYVMIQGFRLATGGRFSKREFFMSILKFALVIYFSVGVFGTDTTTDPLNNGLILLREIVQDGMESFSNMLVEASVGQIASNVEQAGGSLCDFSSVSYSEGYSYLRMWDTLDCKISYYLGWTMPTSNGQKIMESGTGLMKMASGIYSLLWGLLGSMNFFLIIFIFAFGIFLLSLVVYFTQFYIVAMMAVTIMIFFGPLFVPLALFGPTKGYFDKWLSTLLGYALQPVIVVGVISFMIATFDYVLYADCSFQRKDISDSPYWILDESTNKDGTTVQSQYCQDSYGFSLAILEGGKYMLQGATQGDTNNSDGSSTLYTYPATSKDINETTMVEGLMLTTFFAFLFYYFASQIGNFAQELSGVSSLGKQTMSPTATFDAAMTAITRGRFKKAKQAVKASKTGSKESDLSDRGDGISVSSGNRGSGIRVGVSDNNS